MRFNKEILIGNKKITEHSNTFVVAEAGVNHNGNMTLAKQMIDVAYFIIACFVYSEHVGVNRHTDGVNFEKY